MATTDTTPSASSDDRITLPTTDNLVVQNGTRSIDRLSGTEANDYLLGHGGNDILWGLQAMTYLTAVAAMIGYQGAPDVMFLLAVPAATFFLNIDDRPKNQLREADIVTDFQMDGEADRIYLGRSIRTVWTQRQDVDGDGRQDTVLYDNATSQSGIHVILLDFAGPLEGNDFYLAAPLVLEIA